VYAQEKKKELDDSWRGWLRENLDRECDPFELMNILRKNGFDMLSIKESMGSSFPVLPSPAEYAAIADVRITKAELSRASQLLTPLAQVYTLPDFLSQEECNRIVELSASVLRPSTVTTNDKKYRTSSTSDLSLLQNPDVQALDEKIARTLGIRLEYSEAIQAQRYEVGQEFKPHTDYFQPRTDEFVQYASKAGQRTWTFMVYLNDGMIGGGTRFIHLNTTFTPKKGMAVIWNNLQRDGSVNPATLHAGQPVERGHKIIITKWFRDRGSGPMFYQ
jgi:prolyl 4-hydroxylase